MPFPRFPVKISGVPPDPNQKIKSATAGPSGTGSTKSQAAGHSVKDKNSNHPSHGSSSVKSLGGESSKSKRDNSERYRLEMEQRERLVKILEEKREQLANTRRTEKQIMLCFACLAVISGVFWLVAVGTDYWYYVYGNEALLSSGNSSGAKLFVRSNAGLWRVCRTVRDNTTDEVWCRSFSFMPQEEDFKKSEGTTKEVIDFMRTEISFALISLFLMVMSVPVAFYTFTNSRYTFKRFASGLYFFSSATILVVLQVTDAKIRFEHEHVDFIHPKDSTFSYGFCYYTGWVVLSLYFITSVLFLWYSRKRKGDKALDDEDEGQIMGR